MLYWPIIISPASFILGHCSANTVRTSSSDCQEDKPRRHRKALADAAGELADELNLTEEDKQNLKGAFEDGDWEGFEEGADIVGDENAEKLFNKLDGAEKDFDDEEAERPAKGDRPAKDGEAPAKEE